MAEALNSTMLEMCDACTPAEEFAYSLIASGLGLVGVLSVLVFYCSCKGSETDLDDCVEVIKCDCDFWDDIEKPFMPAFLGFQCICYSAVTTYHWQLCTTQELTVEGQYFIVLFMVSAFFLFLNLCCCFSVRNNIEAKIRTCFTFLLDVALCGALGLAAAIGVNEVELNGGQLLGSCATMYDCGDANGTAYNASALGNSTLPCPADGASTFAAAFSIGALGAQLLTTAGNCAFGYILTLWGVKARAVILTLNSLVAANFMGAVELAGVKMATEGFSPDVLNSVVAASSAASAMAAAALKLEKASYVLQGAALGKTAIVPILALIERPLREDVAMCSSEVGEPTEEYSNGEWLECDPQRQMGATWALASVNMAAIGSAMGLGTTKPQLVGALACAMMGADMCVASLSSLVETVAPSAAGALEVNRVFITYALCFCGWRVQYVLRGDDGAAAKKDSAEGGEAKGEGGEAAPAAEEEPAAAAAADDGDGEGGEKKDEEGGGDGGGDDDGKKKKKKKKKPLGPKVMKACQKKIPGLDSVLIKQYDFLDKSKPARILLTFDVAIKHLVGSAPEGAPKPDPKAAARQFLAKIKSKIKNRGKIGVAPGGLPDAMANAPDLADGKAGKLPPIEKPQP
jgi:hypothetical protein